LGLIADLSKARPVVFPNLKTDARAGQPADSRHHDGKIRRLANRRGISYQSLIASWLAERAEQEMKAA